MFHTYTSTSVRELATVFAEILYSRKSDPFEAPWVIVQNNEIREWLSLKLAEENEIAGNIRFILPSEFIWTLYRLKEPELPQHLPADLNSMRWGLFHMFNSKPELLNHLPVEGLKPGATQRLFQFCGQLADVFDLYQVYRPELAAKWEQSVLGTRNPEERWQALIWKEFRTFSEAQSGSGLPSRGDAFKSLQQWISDSPEFRSLLPGSLFIFGLSHMSEPFADITARLGGAIDVHYFSAENYPDDEEPVSALMNQFSRSRREQEQMLETLLSDLDIPHRTQNYTEAAGSSYTLPQIRVHGSHSIRRECEVLKQEVLHYLNEHRDADAGDILIMVPDTEAYGSTLQTIFTDDSGDIEVPVSGLSTGDRDAVSYLLIRLLESLTGRIKSTDISELLGLRPVQDAFDFGDEDLHAFEHHLSDNRFYFGLGGQPDELYSFEKALNQLFSGYSMEPEPLSHYRGLVPDTTVNQTADLQRTARLSRFKRTLSSVHSGMQEDKSPAEWMLWFSTLIRQFTGDDPSYIFEKQRLLKKLMRLEAQVDISGYSDSVPWQMIAPWIKGQLQENRSASGRFGQGITLSTYVPYRSLPFRFIAVLGMNEGTFPRQAVRPVFDLIQAEPRPGDRILKEDDRHLFAETLRAAKDHLHISYIARDHKTDTEKMPSILVQQLREAAGEESIPVLYHPLHPFSAKNYEHSAFHIYSEASAETARLMYGKSKEAPAFLNLTGLTINSETETDLREVIQFFSHPARYMSGRQLGIRGYDDIAELSEREAFKLEGLDKYRLSHLLMYAMQKGIAKNKLIEYSRSSMLIPEGKSGMKAFDHEYEFIAGLWKVFSEYAGNQEEESRDVSAGFGEVEVGGHIGNLYGNRLIHVVPGRVKGKYLIPLWLSHLLLCATSDNPEESLLISKDDKSKLTIIRLPEIPEADAVSIFSDMISWLHTEQDPVSALCFFPDTSLTFAENILDGKETSYALKKAQNTWLPGYNQNFSESTDYYNDLLWRGRKPLEEPAFEHQALRFWQPFLRYREEQ